MTIESLIEKLGAAGEDATVLVPVAGTKRHVPARSVSWSCGCRAMQAARMFRALVGDDARFEPCSDEHDFTVPR